MGDKYTIADEFMVKNTKVLVLDKAINFKDFRASKIMVDHNSYSYGLTHNESWITVKTDEKLLGKELTFVS